MTLSLTLDRAILHTVAHRPLPTRQILLKLEKLFVDERTYGRTDI